MFGFQFWVTYLRIISIIFAAMGLMWAVLGSFDPFGIYDSRMAQSFFAQDKLPTDAKQVFSFTLAPFGMTALGYFILQYFIATYAFAKRERWAFVAITFAFSVWFIGDTILSLQHGAVFNVLLANIPSLVAMLPIFIATPTYFFQNPQN